MSDQPFNLNLHAARLLMREPFFAALSRRINKSSSKVVPVARAIDLDAVQVPPHLATDPAFEFLLRSVSVSENGTA